MEFSKPSQFRFGKGFPSFLQRREPPPAGKADPSVSVDYLQGIVIETKDGAMAGVYYWRCKTTGDQRRAWELNRFTLPLVQQSNERWKLSDMRRITGDSQADAPPSFFLQESTAVSYGTCTQQNFNAKQAEKTMLPAHKVNWFPAFVCAITNSISF